MCTDVKQSFFMICQSLWFTSFSRVFIYFYLSKQILGFYKSCCSYFKCINAFNFTFLSVLQKCSILEKIVELTK